MSSLENWRLTGFFVIKEIKTNLTNLAMKAGALNLSDFVRLILVSRKTTPITHIFRELSKVTAKIKELEYKEKTQKNSHWRKDNFVWVKLPKSTVTEINKNLRLGTGLSFAKVCKLVVYYYCLLMASDNPGDWEQLSKWIPKPPPPKPPQPEFVNLPLPMPTEPVSDSPKQPELTTETIKEQPAKQKPMAIETGKIATEKKKRGRPKKEKPIEEPRIKIEEPKKKIVIDTIATEKPKPKTEQPKIKPEKEYVVFSSECISESDTHEQPEIKVEKPLPLPMPTESIIASPKQPELTTETVKQEPKVELPTKPKPKVEEDWVNWNIQKWQKFIQYLVNNGNSFLMSIQHSTIAKGLSDLKNLGPIFYLMTNFGNDKFKPFFDDFESHKKARPINKFLHKIQDFNLEYSDWTQELPENVKQNLNSPFNEKLSIREAVQTVLEIVQRLIIAGALVPSLNVKAYEEKEQLEKRKEDFTTWNYVRWNKYFFEKIIDSPASPFKRPDMLGTISSFIYFIPPILYLFDQKDNKSLSKFFDNLAEYYKPDYKSNKIDIGGELPYIVTLIRKIDEKIKLEEIEKYKENKDSRKVDEYKRLIARLDRKLKMEFAKPENWNTEIYELTAREAIEKIVKLVNDVMEGKFWTTEEPKVELPIEPKPKTEEQKKIIKVEEQKKVKPQKKLYADWNYNNWDKFFLDILFDKSPFIKSDRTIIIYRFSTKNFLSPILYLIDQLDNEFFARYFNPVIKKFKEKKEKIHDLNESKSLVMLLEKIQKEIKLDEVTQFKLSQVRKERENYYSLMDRLKEKLDDTMTVGQAIEKIVQFAEDAIAGTLWSKSKPTIESSKIETPIAIEQPKPQPPIKPKSVQLQPSKPTLTLQERMEKFFSLLLSILSLKQSESEKIKLIKELNAEYQDEDFLQKVLVDNNEFLSSYIKNNHKRFKPIFLFLRDLNTEDLLVKQWKTGSTALVNEIEKIEKKLKAERTEYEKMEDFFDSLLGIVTTEQSESEKIKLVKELNAEYQDDNFLQKLILKRPSVQKYSQFNQLQDEKILNEIKKIVEKIK